MNAQILIPWFRYHPFTVEVGPLDVKLYPFQVAMWIGVATTLVIAFQFAKAHGRPLRATIDFGAHILVFAFPISKIFNGLFYEPGMLERILRDPTSIVDVWHGWSMVGGVLGGIVGAWVWKWRRGGSILEVGDAFAFGGPFGFCIGRIGCFAVHDHPGRVSNFFLAVADYQVGKPPWPPRHDLGLYEAIVLAVISILFWWIGRKPTKPGLFFGLLGLLFAPARFFLDFLRAPLLEGGDVRYGGLTPSQYVSLGFFVAGVMVLRRVYAGSQAPT